MLHILIIDISIGLERLPTGDQLKRLPLLRNVIRETMRLYPPLGLNVRQARHDLSLPSGGGPNGKLPVAVLQGQQVGKLTPLTFSPRVKNSKTR